MELVDTDVTSNTFRSFFSQLQEKYGLANVAYYAHTLPAQPADACILWTTYLEEWQKHYFENQYQRIDPVIAIDRSSLLPVDWDCIPRNSKAIKSFFGEAAEFKVGANGLAIPVRGPKGDRAIFAITSNAPKTEWEKIRKHALPDFVAAANFVHQSAMQETGIYSAVSDAFRLSPREIECLRWAAAGKSFKDISCILNISERVTRAYLDTARHKLNALNVTHAVSRAIGMGLIAPG